VLVLAQRAQLCGTTRRVFLVLLLVPAQRVWVDGATRSVEMLRAV
ncbi:hypothetical protein A2U01_0052498, partial [Trifolium medium]|nr:hypothetical protein [Trifolium medium]